MATPIYTTSPINKFKTKIGWVDTIGRVATFEITPKRYFQEARCVGIDEDIFRRKTIQWCREFVFKMWDGRGLRIKKEDFMANCWLYPSKEDARYKANKAVFKPKLMILLKKVEELAEKNKKTPEERTVEMFLNGVFG